VAEQRSANLPCEGAMAREQEHLCISNAGGALLAARWMDIVGTVADAVAEHLLKGHHGKSIGRQWPALHDFEQVRGLPFTVFDMDRSLSAEQPRYLQHI
jgi:hypothetical protein